MVVVVCFFFFFRQKTAYEMRISDWSSDVCSSDLHVDISESMIRVIARQAEAERERRAKVINAEGELQAAQKLLEAAEIMSGRPEEIGRASWRERVCQYV